MTTTQIGNRMFLVIVAAIAITFGVAVALLLSPVRT